MEHSVYWQMYCDIWEYHKKYISNLEDSNEFWHKLAEEGKDIARKYNNHRFINNLVANEMAELEEVFKKKSKESA